MRICQATSCSSRRLRSDVAQTSTHGGKQSSNQLAIQETYNWSDSHLVLVVQSGCIDKYGWDPDCDRKWWFQPTITKVSGQIRKEALEMFYDTIEFRAFG